jgi:hypothetical protein
MRHPTISAWQREEDGSYAAEIDGWSLRVAWHHEGAERFHGQRGFTWTAERDDEKLSGDELFEEIEVAMGQAEEHVAPDPAAHAKPAELDGGHGEQGAH